MLSYHLFWWAAWLSASYGLLLGLYRVYLHPLAKFPGPKLAAATGWYETYIDLFQWPRRSFVDEIARLHRIYGPIVRISPQEIHVRDSTWLDTLYAGPSHGKKDKYAPAALMTGTSQGIFGTVPHELHRLRRAAINPLFSKPNVAAAVPMIFELTDKLLVRIKTQVARDGFADMRTNSLAFTTDTASQYSTGQSRQLLDNETLAFQWRRSMTNVARWTSIGRHFSLVLLLILIMPMALLKLIFPDVLLMVGLHRDIFAISLQNIRTTSQDHKMTAKKVPPNVFSTIISSSDFPPSEKAAERISQGVELVAAGSETAARTITTAIYFTLRNKNAVQAKLEEELERKMPDPSLRPSLKELQSLPWLSVIIRESLRLMALPTMRFPLVSPRENLYYNDWVIPPGTPVSMTFRDVLLDDKIFEKPHEFHPERWLNSNPSAQKLNRYFMPFGRGNRMCIGMGLAYAELYIVLACVFRRLKLQLHDSIADQDLDIMCDCFIGETPDSTKGLRVDSTGTVQSVSLESQPRIQGFQVRRRCRSNDHHDRQAMLWPTTVQISAWVQ
ncbi:putative cytochrome P450 [Xylaria scruposa]|nr:putative cytochrome P450 [Xylaria scruposa]